MLAIEKIRQYRKNAGMDMNKLASRIGVTQGTISRYENGYVRRISDDMLEKLAGVFNCTISDLIGDDPAYGHLQNDETRKAILQSNMTGDDQLILNWYHSLSPEVRSFFKNCARQNLNKPADQ